MRWLSVVLRAAVLLATPTTPIWTRVNQICRDQLRPPQHLLGKPSIQALLQLYEVHNWDCTLKTRRGLFDSSNK